MSIQIIKIFKASFKSVWEHLLEWARVVCAPVIVFLFGLLFMAIMYWAAGQPLWSIDVLTNEVQPQNLGAGVFLITLGNIVYYIAHFIAIIVLYINGFRYAILDEGGDRWWTLEFNMRFVRMILYNILIAIFVIVYTALSIGIVLLCIGLIGSTAVSIIVGTLLILYAIYLFTRLSLTAPLVAIDQNTPLRTGWRLLKGNVLRLIGLIILISLAFLGIIIVGFALLGLLTWILSLISPWLSGIGIVLMAAFGIFLWFLAITVGIKALALVYKTFTEGVAF